MIAPPLLLLAEGRRPKLKKPPVWRPKEYELHIEVANLLRDHCLPEWQWTHFPAGEKRDARTGARLKRMGLKRGWPDILMFSPTAELHCLELKREGEDLTPEQEVFLEWCHAHNVLYALARTVTDALGIFDNWGCLRIKL